MKKRRDRDPHGPGSCQICGGDGQGHVYEFWTGRRERVTEANLYDGRTRTKATYSDMTMIHSFVCDSCAGAVQRKAYRVRFFAWGAVLPLALIPLAGCLISDVDTTSKFICSGVIGVMAIPIGLVFLYYAWQMFRPPQSSPQMDKLVLNEVRTKWPHKRGYDYFTTAEYEDHFNRE